MNLVDSKFYFRIVLLLWHYTIFKLAIRKRASPYIFQDSPLTPMLIGVTLSEWWDGLWPLEDKVCLGLPPPPPLFHIYSAISSHKASWPRRHPAAPQAEWDGWWCGDQIFLTWMSEQPHAGTWAKESGVGRIRLSAWENLGLPYTAIMEGTGG